MMIMIVFSLNKLAACVLGVVVVVVMPVCGLVDAPFYNKYYDFSWLGWVEHYVSTWLIHTGLRLSGSALFRGSL